MLIIILVLLAGLLLFSSTSIAATSWESPTNLSNNSSSNTAPSMSSNSLNDVFATWSVSGGAIGVQNIYVATKPENGSWSAPEFITRGYASNKALGVDNSGNIHLVYREDGARPHAGYYRIYDGQSWSSPMIAYPTNLG